MNEESKNHMEMSVKATRDKGGFFRNLATNIKGPAVSVVLVAWLAAVVFISVYGKTPFGAAGMGLLSIFIVIYLMIMGNRQN